MHSYWHKSVLHSHKLFYVYYLNVLHTKQMETMNELLKLYF